MKNRPLRHRIAFARAGIHAGWSREASFRIQLGMAMLAGVALVALRPAAIWWALVAVTCGAVLALELVNSALEAVIDLLHPGMHPSIRIAKDMLAGAVLVMSLAAVAVAVAMVLDTVPWLVIGAER